MNKEDVKRSYNMMINAYKQYKGDDKAFTNSNIASVVIDRDTVVGLHTVGGMSIRYKNRGDTLFLDIDVADNVEIKHPVHICFGVTTKSFHQKIESKIHVGINSKVRFLSHCIFPDSKDVIHDMHSKYILEKGAFMEYNEEHYHSDKFGAKVNTFTEIIMNKGSTYNTEFRAIRTKIGEIQVGYSVDVFDEATFVNTLRGYLLEGDRFITNENVNLKGKNSSAIIRSDMAVKDGAYAHFGGEIVATGDFSKGHIECLELMVGNGRVEAIPKLDAQNKTARLTHEASLGTVKEEELLNLMSKGLAYDEAVDLIVNGKLFKK